ncbi:MULTISPECIES: hypothetical protein [Bacillati]|uniref:hypothetical protein n=1 Tax=Bacillati TaxID=1783272 RepID=UPI0022B96FE0|nr:hypothetical protein [Caldifermentibacillus hisashii]
MKEEKALKIVNNYCDFQMDKLDDDDIVNAYATYLLATTSLSKDISGVINDLSKHSLITGDFMYKVAEQVIEDMQVLDSDFHSLHCLFPELRENAIRLISSEKGDIRSLRTSIQTISDDGKTIDVSHITNQLKQEVGHLTDVTLSFGETYLNDHRMWEDGYYAEYLIVYVHSVDLTSADMAIDTLKKVLGNCWDY